VILTFYAKTTNLLSYFAMPKLFGILHKVSGPGGQKSPHWSL